MCVYANITFMLTNTDVHNTRSFWFGSHSHTYLCVTILQIRTLVLLNGNQVGGGVSPPSSYTTVRTDPYTAVR